VASVTIEVDLPPGVEISAYERHQEGHGFEVRWPLPELCRCERCAHEERAHIEFKTAPQAIRDLDVWGRPSFWIYQAPFHRCGRCGYRQHIIPPFKRKEVSYTYRFEQFVLRSLIGSTAEDVARRLGISAETVERIVEYQLNEDRRIDPTRVITDIGLDELSLKKRHRLYVTLMTDLSDPERPRILAVARGKDFDAAQKCLDLLSEEQRQQVRTHRVDMGSSYPSACAARLKNSRAVTDRFHVAKKFNEVVDTLRKKLTREYKAKLKPAERKAFRAQMWAFRRDPEGLTAEEKEALEGLFEVIPQLKDLYQVRVRFKGIFDTARDRTTAARWLRDLRREAGRLGLDLAPFFATYDRWKTEILNYFDARQTSAAVEGINNKARVITKRTYGLKSAQSLWNRLILDLNRASEAIGWSIEQIRQIAKGLTVQFDWSCT
jgi:transposase